jgi:hypothetical protein
MKNGDAFAKKFGGATGNDPDFLKLTVKGYSGGTLKPDSIEFYLADFRFNNNSLDYILKTWQWVDCSTLGAVDSVTFYMYSSDNSFGFMNTPAFFSIDNFTTAQGVGIAEHSFNQKINLFPNPANTSTTIHLVSEKAFTGSLSIYNSIGALMRTEIVAFNAGETNYSVDLTGLNKGFYYIELIGDNKKQNIKFIKQ